MTRASRIEAAARAVVDAWDEDGRITTACASLRAALDSRDDEAKWGVYSGHPHGGWWTTSDDDGRCVPMLFDEPGAVAKAAQCNGRESGHVVPRGWGARLYDGTCGKRVADPSPRQDEPRPGGGSRYTHSDPPDPDELCAQCGLCRAHLLHEPVQPGVLAVGVGASRHLRAHAFVCPPVGPPAPAFPRAPKDAEETESVDGYSVGADSCLVEKGGYLCERVEDHPGDHVASDGVRIVARWPAKGPVIGWRLWLGDGYYEGRSGCQPVSRKRAFLFRDGGSFVYDNDHGGGRAWVRAVAQFLREQYGATPRVRAVRRKVRP